MSNLTGQNDSPPHQTALFAHNCPGAASPCSTTWCPRPEGKAAGAARLQGHGNKHARLVLRGALAAPDFTCYNVHWDHTIPAAMSTGITPYLLQCPLELHLTCCNVHRDHVLAAEALQLRLWPRHAAQVHANHSRCTHGHKLESRPVCPSRLVIVVRLLYGAGVWGFCTHWERVMQPGIEGVQQKLAALQACKPACPHPAYTASASTS